MFLKLLLLLSVINIQISMLNLNLAKAEERASERTSSSRTSSKKRPTPPRRIPPNKVKPGGGLDFARQACVDDTESLVALVPTDDPVATTKPYPSFFFYVPDRATNINYGEFSLLSADNKSRIYQTSVTFKKTPGIVKIDLPSNPQYALEEGKLYHWYFTIYCNNDSDRSVSLDVNGWIQRIPLTSTRKEKIEAASTDIWYDSLIFVANNSLKFPHSQKMQLHWFELLRHINLEHLVKAPILETSNEHYSLEGSRGTSF